MAVINDLEPRVRDEVCQHAAINDGNQGIVPAHEYERWLAQSPQPRKAAPADHSQELIQIAQAVRARHGVGMAANQRRILFKGAAVNLRRLLRM